jgi:hypothetical protein
LQRVRHAVAQRNRPQSRSPTTATIVS